MVKMMAESSEDTDTQEGVLTMPAVLSLLLLLLVVDIGGLREKSGVRRIAKSL